MDETKVGSIAYDLNLDDSKFKGKVDDVSRQVDGLSGKFKNAEPASQAFAAGLAAVGVAATAFAMSSVQAYNESEKTVAQLDAVLKSTKEVMSQEDKTTTSRRLSTKATAELNEKLADANARLHDMEARWNSSTNHTETASRSLEKARANVASLSAQLGHAGDVITHKFIAPTQLSREELLKLSQSLQQTTTFSDEAVLSAENLLLTFTNIGKKVFPEATQTVLDMSIALGQDTKSSAIQLGKALQDPILGVSALRRVGVNFSEDQQNVIKKLVETGHALDAQKMILKELATEFGGSAAAAARTFEGQLTILKNNFNDFQEVVGKAITDRLRPLIQVFNDWMTSMGGPEGMLKKLTQAFEQMQPYIPIIAGLIAGALTPAFAGLAASIGLAVWNLLPFVVIGGLIGLLVKELVEHFGGWKNIMDMLNPVLEYLGGIFRDVIKPQLQEVWFMFKEQLIPALRELWDVVSPILIPVLQFLGTVLGVSLLGFIMILIGGLKLLIFVFTEVVNEVKDFVKKVVDNFKWLYDVLVGHSIIPDLINEIVAWFTSLPGKIRNALSGIGNIIKDAFAGAFSWLMEKLDSIASKFRDALDLTKRHSPSVLDIVKKGVNLVNHEFGTLADVSMPKMSADLAKNLNGGGDSQSSNTNNMPVTIYIDKVGDQQDVQAIGRELGFRLNLAK